MCGICGILNADDGVVREKVETMLQSLRHRGPDASNTWHDERLCLGNCCLAVIGLGEVENQPMSNEDETIWITCDGLIYNFARLKEELIRHGHKFRSITDTEVIIHLYEEYGTDCLSHLRGMFAFAIWDKKKGSLFLARDRLGIKPLYYTCQGNHLAFASEVTAFLEAGVVAKELDEQGVIGFFSLGSVPQPHTIIRGVKVLPAGHWLEFNNGVLKTSKYWQPSFLPKKHLSPQDACSMIRAQLEESVSSHLVSEVSSGAFLSGGIDSSIIVALMSKFATGRVKTFNITFAETSYSEAKFAKSIATRFETEHTEYEINGDHLKAELGNIVRAMDQPTVNGVNTYFVSQITRESGTVVALSGLGGDELFCGYQTFKDIPKLYRGLAPLRFAPTSIKNLLYRLLSVGSAGIIRQKLACLLSSSLSLEEIYAVYRACFVSDILSHIIKPDFWNSRDISFGLDYAREVSQEDNNIDSIDRIASLEMSTYMSNQLLRDTDVMSMTHSLEVRTPYLDHVFVESVCHLPSQLRNSGSTPKALLTSALRDLLPPEVINRKKQGFTFPLDLWLRQELRPLVSEVLSPENTKKIGVLQPTVVDSLWKQFLRGKNTVHWSRVWAPFVFQLWCSEVLK